MKHPSSCCKRSVVMLILLSCVWHLGGGIVAENGNPEFKQGRPSAFIEAGLPQAADPEFQIASISRVPTGVRTCR